MAQALNAQTVTLSGSTGAGTAHKHTIGNQSVSHKHTFPKGGSTNEDYPSAKSYTVVQTMSDKTTGNITVSNQNASHTHTLGDESAHTHSFSGVTASFGSGSYIRPTSRKAFYYLKY